MKIKKGDTVKVITGKDKGKKGEVVKVLPQKSKVLVKGVNIVTKHKKYTGNKTQPGGRLKVEAPIHVSNVMHIGVGSSKPTRIGYEIDPKTKKKYRISKKTGKRI